MGVIPEPDVHGRKLPPPLDVDLLGTVDQDVGDQRVSEERLERPEPRDLVYDLLDQSFTAHRIEFDLLMLHELGDGLPDLLGQRPLIFDLAQRRQVHVLDDLAVKSDLQLVEWGQARRTWPT